MDSFDMYFPQIEESTVISISLRVRSLTAECQILPLGTPTTNAKVKRESSEKVMSSLPNALANFSR